MNEEELLEKNNIILSHGKLPKGMSTCENYGLSGNCGINCPLFKNGTCEVYQDVVERVINNLQSKIDKAIEYLDEVGMMFDNETAYRINEYPQWIKLKNILKEDK